MQTDAALEIVELIDDLRTIPNSGGTAFSVMAEHWGVDENSTEFLELVGVVSSRFNEFKKFVEKVKDPYVTPRVRSKVLASIIMASGAVQPARLSGAWQYVLGSNLSEEHISNIELFSSIAAKHRPLKKLDDDERSLLLTTLTKQIDQIEDADIPEWIGDALCQSLEKLINTIRYLKVFGHGKAIDEVSFAFQRFASLYETTSSSEDSKDKNATQIILTGMNIIMLAANMFIMPDQALTAFERYKGWVIKPVVQAQITPPPTQKLISHSSTAKKKQ